MMQQITLFDYLEEIENENEIEKMDNIEILNKIEVETNLNFQNVKYWRCGFIDYWTTYKKAKISVGFGINKKNKKYISVSYEEKNRGRAVPCESINEAIEVIKSYFKIQDEARQ